MNPDPTTDPIAASAAYAPAWATIGRADLLQVTSLALWLQCLAVGLLGLGLAYPAPTAVPSTPAAVAVENADVQISDAPLSAAGPKGESAAATKAPTEAPTLSSAPPALADPPAMAALASPALPDAFATPAQGRATIPEPAQAGGGSHAPGPAGAPSGSSGQPGAVQHLIFGHGQGRQPAPLYPREAKAAGQQGDVVVEFDVNQTGRITEAHVIDPCRWPLLNQAALQAVRERWRFDAGPLRAFEISIRFELH